MEKNIEKQFMCPNCKNTNGLLKIPGKLFAIITFDVFKNEALECVVDRTKGIETKPWEMCECVLCGHKADRADFDGDSENLIDEDDRDNN